MFWGEGAAKQAGLVGPNWKIMQIWCESTPHYDPSILSPVSSLMYTKSKGNLQYKCNYFLSVYDNTFMTLF